MSMKNFLQAAQADVASQVEESSVATKSSAIKKMVAAGAVALLATFSMGAQAQYNQYNQQDNTMSNAAGQIGALIGVEAGRSANLGNELGRIFGVGASTLARVAAGQSVNGADVGGTIGQVTGAMAGYGVAGGKDASTLGKAVGIIAGGGLGAVLGSGAGRGYDQYGAQKAMDARNAPTPTIITNAQDQQDFLRGMQSAAQSRGYAQARPGSQVSPEQIGFHGYLGQSFSRTGLPLMASGAAQMPESAMVSVANKAMEVVKIGKAYNDATVAWDNAFMVGQSPAVKNQINVAVVNTDAMMKIKMLEYTQTRNAAATRGFDVSLMDGAIANQLPNLRQQTNYGFATNYQAASRP